MDMETSQDKICPFCTNGTTLAKQDILRYGTTRIYVRKERVYYEDDGKKILMKPFYFCPFCGREFGGRHLWNRRFRGE